MDENLQPLSFSTQPKKSIFKNRPAWAAGNTNTATHDDQIDLFNRQEDALAKFQQEEAKQKEKVGKTENREKRQREEPRPVKKRRVSEHEGSSSDGDAPTEPKPKLPYPSKRFTFNRNLLKPPSKEKSPNKTVTSSSQSRDEDTVVISIDDDDDEANGTGRKDESILLEKPRLRSSVKSGPATDPTVLDENDVDLDEEISRLAQRARERQQQQRQKQSQDGDASPIDNIELVSPTKDRALAAVTRKQQLLPSGTGLDPVLKILVHSEMPDTVPLIVQRKLSQRLKEVKTAWCTKNNIGDDVAHSISLYWRGRKLYESSTCRSLGLEVNGDGELYFKGSEQDAGPENAQIEMEAMTPQLVEDKRRAKEHNSKPKEEEELQDIKKSEPGIKVILRGQGYGDYKIIVRSHTPINQLVKVFRNKRNISEDKEIFLMFDGEKLNEEESIQDTELADMDTIEVHVK